ncbi:MAG: MFS transporter [Actinomycetia bacterium]|nr:MFS transporter [Actinomycetes bacterium]MCP3913790.1 MFS transporter [Actinomycetes bacterium]MCP4083577.1 MFS transporter [Actinomycetes bacterium]
MSETAPRFRGWWILLWCTVAISLTAPGQTIGVASFIDHLIEDLGVSRSTISSAYLFGTITGAACMPFIGRWIDQVGIRRSMTIIVVAFGAAVIAAGGVQGPITLALSFVGIRLLGQGSLSLVGQTGIALWFDHKRGIAIAISMTVSAALMALAPLVLTSLIDGVGWRQTWLMTGLFLWVTLIPIARWGLVDRPSDIGQLPDGLPPHSTNYQPQRSFTRGEALRTPAFWSLEAIAVLAGALVTGITFHHISIMEARGLTETQAAAVFIPQMIGTVATGFLFGWLTDRVSPRVLLPITGSFLSAGLLLGAVAEPGFLAVAYGVVVGLNAGSVRALSSALHPRWFGTEHIGAIRGVAFSIGVGSSAIGPLIVSVGHDLADSYGPVLVISAVVTLGVSLATALVPTPASG